MMDEIASFVEQLISIGGVWTIDEQGYIKSVSDNVILNLKAGNKTLPVKIYQPNMVGGEFLILNPFTENNTTSHERDWFCEFLSSIPGILIKHTIKVLINSVHDKEDGQLGYGALDLVSPHLGKIDEKMLEEISQLQGSDFLRIHFDRRNRDATAVSKVFDPEVQAEYTNIRKKTWQVITSILDGILNTSDPAKMFHYKATIIGMQKVDAIINTLGKVLRAIYKPIEEVLDIELKLPELLGHIENLEKYHKASQWLIGTSSVTPTTTPTQAPWKAAAVPVNGPVNPMMMQHQQQPQQPVMAVPASAVPSASPYQNTMYPQQYGQYPQQQSPYPQQQQSPYQPPYTSPYQSNPNMGMMGQPQMIMSPPIMGYNQQPMQMPAGPPMVVPATIVGQPNIVRTNLLEGVGSSNSSNLNRNRL